MPKDNGESSLALQPPNRHDISYISSIPPRPALASYFVNEIVPQIPFRELQFLAVNDSCPLDILTLYNLARFPAIKELCAITADLLWDRREDWNWIKVKGKIE